MLVERIVRAQADRAADERLGLRSRPYPVLEPVWVIVTPLAIVAKRHTARDVDQQAIEGDAAATEQNACQVLWKASEASVTVHPSLQTVELATVEPCSPDASSSLRTPRTSDPSC